MRELRTREEIDAALADSGVIFKHSNRCPVSYDAYNEVARFELMHPEVPVHLLDVVLFRSLARHVADVTGIGHHSPQVIVVKEGIIQWHGSHYAINALVLERHVAGTQSASAEEQS